METFVRHPERFPLSSSAIGGTTGHPALQRTCNGQGPRLAHRRCPGRSPATSAVGQRSRQWPTCGASPSGSLGADSCLAASGVQGAIADLLPVCCSCSAMNRARRRSVGQSGSRSDTSHPAPTSPVSKFYRSHICYSDDPKDPRRPGAAPCRKGCPPSLPTQSARGLCPDLVHCGWA